jgi:uncharacterized membrane protein YbhN (UPF0104 family)
VSRLSRLAQQHTGTLQRARAIVPRVGVWLWSLALVGLGLAFVVTARDELSGMWQALRGARPAWLLAIVALQLLMLALLVLRYRLVLARLGHHVSRRKLLALHLQRTFISTAMPGGGPASVVVLVRRLGQDGVSATDSLVLTGMLTASDTAGLALFAAPIVLSGQLSTPAMAGAGLLIAAVLTLVAGFSLLPRLHAGPGWLRARLPGRVLASSSQMASHQLRLVDLAAPLAIALALDVAEVGMLLCGLRALGQPAAIFTATVAFVACYLLLMVAPLFQGVGVVEVAMALTLQGAGIPLAAAIAATLLFRFGDIWLPFLQSAVVQALAHPALRRILLRRHAPESQAPAPEATSPRSRGAVAADGRQAAEIGPVPAPVPLPARIRTPGD